VKILTADVIIETFGLSKTYHLKGRDKSINALKDVNISIKKGEIFGLLGPKLRGKNYTYPGFDYSTPSN
jgi:ABC-2 type transport system ATP-binding protein